MLEYSPGATEKYRHRRCHLVSRRSNADLLADYAELYENMVAEWRDFFQQPDLPFYAVQLAGWSSEEEHQEGLITTPRTAGSQVCGRPNLRRAAFRTPA